MRRCTVTTVFPSDRATQRAVDELLAGEGLRRDRHLDYTCAIIDDEQVVATGSCYGNTLRCLAVRADRRGEALLNTVVTHLMEVEAAGGHTRLFLYTKAASVRVFRDLGFQEIARVQAEDLVFMENRRDGFDSYLARLAATRVPGRQSAAVVLNANPFSRGHLHLVETAAAASPVVHVFVVREDTSLFPYAVRRRLVEEGTSHLPGIVLHDTDSYIVSSATFPSYFQRDADSVIQGQARLDVTVFGAIGRSLGITSRYVGVEPTSQVTRIYNETMHALLPPVGIDVVEIPRLEVGGRVVSASAIRQAIHDGELEGVRALVPETTWVYLSGPAAQPIRRAIQEADDVVHY